MSDFNVIRDISETLRIALNNRLNRPGQMVSVTVDSPHKENEIEPRVNLFLYLIQQDEHRRNSAGWVPLGRSPAGDRMNRAPEPLAIKLYYLVTAFAADGLSEHRLLGETIQTLHDLRHIPRAALQGSLAASDIVPKTMQLVLLNLGLEDINNIWGNNTALLRASVAYEVSIVFLDPAQERESSPVVQPDGVITEVVPVPFLSYVTPQAAAPGDQIRVYGANLGLPHLRIWVGNRVVDPDSVSAGSAVVTVPDDVSGRDVPIKLQLGDFFSGALPLDVRS